VIIAFQILWITVLMPFFSCLQFEMCRLMDIDARANLMRIRAGSMMDRNEQESAWTRVSQRANSMLEAFGSRTSYDDSYGSSQASTSFPCGPTQQQPYQAPYWSQQHYPGTLGYLLTSYF